MRRRRAPEGSNASEYITGTLKARVDELAINRRKLLAPFPLSGERVYRQFWSDREWEAMMTLPVGIFRRRKSCTIKLPEELHQDINGSKRENINIELDNEYPFDIQAIMFDRLDDESKAQIADWLPLWVKYENERKALTNRVHRLGKVISTYGQAFRLWPDLQGFFSDIGRAKIDKAKVSSRLPDAVYDYRYDETLEKQVITGMKPDWAPESFAAFTEMIAECLLLPEAKDLKEVATLAE